MKKNAVCTVPVLVAASSMQLAFLGTLLSQESDYEFQAQDSLLSETGDDDTSLVLAEGFPGPEEEPQKNLAFEPIDGVGGFDNVAPKLGAEEGPGGLEWDPSPTYRTRYSGATDYPAGSGMRAQGNNWFMRVPYAMYNSYYDQWVVRFDGNHFRLYTKDPYYTGVYWGRYANKYSKLVKSGSGMSEQINVYDIRGKTYQFYAADGYKCKRITAAGGESILFTYSGSNVSSVIQKNAPGSDRRTFTYNYTLGRLTHIAVHRPPSLNYRNIYFTYKESTDTYPEASAGDLIGIQDDQALSPTGLWHTKRWVFKYYTGYSPTTKGYPYQVRALLGPQSVSDWQKANAGANIYSKTTDDLEDYVDRQYDYEETSKRLISLNLKAGCGCGGGEGVYTYVWHVNGTTPSDLNTWAYRATITMPNGSTHLIDYNKYGQHVNYVIQHAGHEWIQKWQHDLGGALTESYSWAACTGYDSGTHVAQTNIASGRYRTYDHTVSGADHYHTVKMWDPGTTALYVQRHKKTQLYTAGDARRFLKTMDRSYPEYTTDINAATAASTTYGYDLYSSFPLTIKMRTSTLPAVSTAQNGPGTTTANLFVVKDWFETNGFNTWSKDVSHDVEGDGDVDGYVHAMLYDDDIRHMTKSIRNINTVAPPAGVTLPVDTLFTNHFKASTASANIIGTSLNVTDSWVYDVAGRPISHEAPEFNALEGTNILTIKTTQQWYYTALSSGDTVTIDYPHLRDDDYYSAAINLHVRDLDGHTLTIAQGQVAIEDDTIGNDILSSQSTLGSAFIGTIVRRTDFTYDGDKVKTQAVYSVPNNLNSTKFTTTYSYDSSGRKEKAVNPVGTITRWTYDGLDRMRTRSIGTDDGSPGNMTKVEELFYDDATPTDRDSYGLLTRSRAFTYTGGQQRDTEFQHDYRGRIKEQHEPENVKTIYEYSNRDQVVLQETRNTSDLPFARSETLYDSWGRIYQVKRFAVPGQGGTVTSNFAADWTWYNGRGQVIKTKTRGKVLDKTEYDGDGRIIRRSVSYDTSEVDTNYHDASDLDGDVVIDETRYSLGSTGVIELVGHYERRHNGTGSGALAVGTGGNARAQYFGVWYDKLGRRVHEVNYGTNGGLNIASRPTGVPPLVSGTEHLVTKQSYTIRSEVQNLTDTLGRIYRKEYDGAGRIIKTLANYVNGTTGEVIQDGYKSYESGVDPYANDDDKTVEYTYNANGQVLTINENLSYFDESIGDYVDRKTENVYGVTRGTPPDSYPDSYVSSNDLLRLTKYPEPDQDDEDSPGQPSSDINDQVQFAYNAQGELIWRQDQQGATHVLTYDLRGRLIGDEITTVSAGARKISRTYDTLDRPITISTWEGDPPSTKLDEITYSYNYHGVVSSIKQDWTPQVAQSFKTMQLSYSFPANGTTPIKQTQVTYPSGKWVANSYATTVDDILARISSKNHTGGVLFQDSFLGLSRQVERSYNGVAGFKWTVVGTPSSNLDNYMGLDRFGRIIDLRIENSSYYVKRYSYAYDTRSRIVRREDLVGNIGGIYEFDETFAYDNLGRVVDHMRGAYTAGSMSPIRFHECWLYDRLGNVRDYRSGSTGYCTPATIKQKFNASNEIIERATYNPVTGDLLDSGQFASYNDRGSLIEKGFATDQYSWDEWNRLTQATNYPTDLARYTYNGLGQITSRTNSNSGQPDVRFYYDDAGNVVEELRIDNGNSHRWYIWGSQGSNDIVASGPTIRYSLRDAVGSVVARTDGSGAIVGHYIYDAYGMPSQYSSTWSLQSITEDMFLFRGMPWHADHAQYASYRLIVDPGVWSNILGNQARANAQADEKDDKVITPVGMGDSCPQTACCKDNAGTRRNHRFDPCKGERACPDGQTLISFGPCEWKTGVAPPGEPPRPTPKEVVENKAPPYLWAPMPTTGPCPVGAVGQASGGDADSWGEVDLESLKQQAINRATNRAKRAAMDGCRGKCPRGGTTFGPQCSPIDGSMSCEVVWGPYCDTHMDWAWSPSLFDPFGTMEFKVTYCVATVRCTVRCTCYDISRGGRVREYDPRDALKEEP